MNDIAPSVRFDRIGQCDPHEVYSHPAYGLIRVSTPTGNIGPLFGSDIRHSSCVSIEICRAEMHRNLSNDRHHETQVLLEIEMSHAQFAQFITSPGLHSGTPCTIRRAPPVGTGSYGVPGIASIETKHDLIRREIEEAARKRMQQIAEQVKRLGDLIESGKLPKGELREIHKELARHAEQTPGSIGFVVEQAQEAIEKATSHAKIEIETYIAHAAHRIGLQHINDLSQIEDRSKAGGNHAD